MSRQPAPSYRACLAGSLRWVLLALATSGSLALLALADDTPAARAPGSAAASRSAPVGASAHGDPARDPVARLGASVEPLSEPAAQALGLAAGTALAVVEVLPDSLAARAGLRARDVITAIAGPVSLGTAGGPTLTATWDALCAALDERPAGGALDFFVRRDGLTRIVHVQLEPLEQAARAVADTPAAPHIACA